MNEHGARRHDVAVNKETFPATSAVGHNKMRESIAKDNGSILVVFAMECVGLTWSIFADIKSVDTEIADGGAKVHVEKRAVDGSIGIATVRQRGGGGEDSVRDKG